jgi:hypothetical protein
MPIGYGYQSRENSSYVDWASVAKGFTDVIDADIKDRENRKAGIEERDRKLSQTLANSPMGQYRDGNAFTSNAVDAITKQKQIAMKLFKAGKISEKQINLINNNILDGTNTLFDLQKTYQSEYAKKMKGITDNSLQAVNAFNMSTIEAYADFSNSKAVVDPATGVINLAKMKKNEKTGLMELTGEIIPVGTGMKNMQTDIPTFDLDGNTTRDAESKGALRTAVLQAAKMSRAGSVTEYLNSPEMMEKTFPGGKKAADEFLRSIDNNVEKYLSVPYNMMSILTQNTGKYGAESYTYDKELAAKDKTKILAMVDPSTGLNVIDPNGPHYKEQRQEAFDYARNQIISKIDVEKKIQSSTGQLSDVTLGRKQFEYGVKKEEQGAKNLGENVGKFFTGSVNEQSDASNYLNKIGISNYITEDADKNPIFNVMGPDGQYVQFAPKTPDEVRSAISSIMGYAKKYISDTQIDETDAVKYAREFSQGKTVNKPGKAIGSEETGQKSYTKDINEYVSSSLDSQIMPNKATETASNLNSTFGGLGFTFEADESTLGTTDDIIIYKKGQDISKEKGVTFSVDDKSQVKNILNWLSQNANATEAQNFFESNPDKKAKAEPTPASAPAPAPVKKTPAPRPGGK